MDMRIPPSAASVHFSLTQLWRTKENHSPDFAICQPLSFYCPLGIQVKGMVTLKLNLLIQSKVNSMSPSIQIILDSDFPVGFVCMKPTNWENSVYSTSLSWYLRERAQVPERTWISLLLGWPKTSFRYRKTRTIFLVNPRLQSLVWAGMD